MKKALLTLSFLVFTVLAQAQIVTFPDANFKNSLLNVGVDTNSDGEIQVSEALAVTSLNLYDYQATDITGIDVFANLQNLTIAFSSLTSLNLSGLNNLQTLDCHGCYNVTSLSVSNSNSLQTLNCKGTRLSSLNFAGLNNLITLNCSDCYELTSITSVGLTNLQNLDCSYCIHLTSLNVSGLTNLITLNCYDCSLTSLNTTGAINLQVIYSSFNYLTTLDVSGLSNLKTLICMGNINLSSINISGSNNITTLNCSNNSITSLDLSNLNNLITLNCSNNSIASLDLSNLNSLTTLNCSDNLLTTLTVSNLTNLTSLDCGYNAIPDLQVNALTNLTDLYFAKNQITAVDISALSNLTSFDCSQNQISTLDLTNHDNLLYLDCGMNLLNTIDVSSLTNLNFLSCNSNHLTVLDVSNLIALTILNCAGNQLTNIDLSNLYHLRDINVSSNLFTSLDFSHAVASSQNPTEYFYQFHNNPNLVYVNLKNEIPGSYLSIGASNCPNLTYICANEWNIYMLNYNLIDSGITGTQVNSYCSFVPSGNHNTITGTLTFDFNNNGCDTNDIALTNTKVFINDGTQTGAAFTTATGQYTFYTQNGPLTLTPELQSSYFTFTPASANITFANNNNNTQIQNFCATALGIHNDLDVVLIPMSPARPGFDANYKLVYKNKGNQVLSGNINLYFNDAVLDFVSANPMTVSQPLNNLNWDFTTLFPFESRTIDLTLNLNSPLESPALNLGDILSFTATINPLQNDETPDDNVFNINQTVVGSYDPNDKTCLEGTTITPSMVGNYLHYVIRFQNTGSYFAQNIVVKDIIDTTKFDINSLELTSSSHQSTTRVTGNKVEFIFENINLPAEIDNEPGSHGYVAFKIKTKNNLVLGNSVQNTADIYFDFNFPVVTNTTSTTVSLLNVNDVENKTVSITPIPVTNILQITALEAITSVQLFDIQGRLLQTKTCDTMSTSLDFSTKSVGVYLVKVYTAKGIKIQKIIKN